MTVTACNAVRFYSVLYLCTVRRTSIYAQHYRYRYCTLLETRLSRYWGLGIEKCRLDKNIDQILEKPTMLISF